MDFIYTIITFLIVLALLLLIIFSALISKLYTGKSIRNPQYAPVAGTVFHQLFYYNRLHDYLTDLGKIHRTFRLLAPDQSELYTTDVQNIEHILKTSFNKYSKGETNVNIISDLFGQGIFAVDGVKWRRQRKFASHEFSTGVLRDFSCKIFRKNAAKLVKTVSEFAVAGTIFDVQVSTPKHNFSKRTNSSSYTLLLSDLVSEDENYPCRFTEYICLKIFAGPADEMCFTIHIQSRIRS